MMRFRIFYTNERAPDVTWPVGTEEVEERVGRTLMKNHYIEVASLDHLLAIVEQYSDVILGGNAEHDYSLEIYNDYRE